MSITGGTLVGPVWLDVQERNAIIASVRDLERELFPQGWDQPGRTEPGRIEPLSLDAVDGLNELRATLGWLEVDQWGRWRWPS